MDTLTECCRLFNDSAVAACKTIKSRIICWFIFIPILFSLTLWFTTKPGDAKPVSVTIVQPNFEPHYEKFTIPERTQLKRFLELSRQSVDSLSSYLVFPETSFEGVQINGNVDNPVVDLFQHFIDSFPQLHLVAGITSYRILKE